uniref:Glutathione peroxidase n=1 Tax=Oryzias latipes TaxID=8090 RepID=A0A3B3HKC8_ORYLA
MGLEFLPHIAYSFVDKSISEKQPKPIFSVYDFFATSLDGQQIPLGTFRNKVLLIVNVATF